MAARKPSRPRFRSAMVTGSVGSRHAPQPIRAITHLRRSFPGRSESRHMRSLSVAGLLAALALSGAAQAQSTPPAASSPQFIRIDENALLSSRLIGSSVDDASGKDTGKIEDVALEGGQIVGVVLSVGEILGGGQRYIAVDPSSISFKYTEGENKWKATLNARIDQLKAAPEFR